MNKLIEQHIKMEEKKGETIKTPLHTRVGASAIIEKPNGDIVVKTINTEYVLDEIEAEYYRWLKNRNYE